MVVATLITSTGLLDDSVVVELALEGIPVGMTKELPKGCLQALAVFSVDEEGLSILGPRDEVGHLLGHERNHLEAQIWETTTTDISFWCNKSRRCLLLDTPRGLGRGLGLLRGAYGFGLDRHVLSALTLRPGRLNLTTFSSSCSSP